MEEKKMDNDEAMFALAAGVTNRAHELIGDGWVKGAFSTREGGAPTKFCILGALDLALDELNVGAKQRHAIHQMAVLFILDEANNQFKYSGGCIPAFNDAAQREHDQVLSVLDMAQQRLWSVSFDEGLQTNWQTKWSMDEVDVNSEGNQAYLSAVLA